MLLVMVLVAATVVAVVMALAMRNPTGPVATLMEEQGLGALLSGTDRTSGPTEVPSRPGTRTTPLTRPRPGATPPPTPTPSEPTLTPDPAPSSRPRKTSASRADLGAFPLFGLTADGMEGPLGLESARVSVVLPADWSHADGQFFDARGQKIGEIGPGPFRYTSGATCATPRVSEMSGPPSEEYGFDFEHARGTFRLTETYCGGGNGTYAGACLVHSYCIEPGSNGLGLMVTFLELSATRDPANEDRYDDVVDSIGIQR